ncbi:MAG TPA: fumarylacetoacetate hydrolase family protein [Acidimicrobiia bacterium]|jgi:2-keto-4-pentenoate hydratase/2-oxohepta-3-ene-1,7-dioic acid hydratase in catechol pathway|nr:fumarylacetoacetate hydrolase family protein [Acidimicrobiia bacterium]
MKIVRIKAGDDIAYGVADAEGVLVHRGTPFVAWEPTETVVPWDRVQLLSPVIPTKVVCVGRNYVDHAGEQGVDLPQEPMIFLKPATAVIGPDASVVLPPASNEVHHEAELAAVINRVARNVRAEEASKYILGYTAANDVTARDLQNRDGQWTRAKGFDTFCPLGPAIETELDPLERLAVICRVNGEVRQAGFTSDMVFGVAEIFEFITTVMTLLPGDVILTGTPAGVGKIEAGDSVEVEIDGIGTLSNRVVRR